MSNSLTNNLVGPSGGVSGQPFDPSEEGLDFMTASLNVVNGREVNIHQLVHRTPSPPGAQGGGSYLVNTAHPNGGRPLSPTNSLAATEQLTNRLGLSPTDLQDAVYAAIQWEQAIRAAK